MTLLVTGGAGFIGANFVHEWLAASDEPVVTLDALTYAGNLDNLASLASDGRHTFVRGSIADHALVAAQLKAGRVRAVLNFAAQTHVDRSIAGPVPFYETNVMATLALLETVRAHVETLTAEERGAFRFIHVSTDEVYGTLDPTDGAFTESSPYRPNNPYAASKAASDHLVRAHHNTYGLGAIVSNCSNNYGPFQYPEKLIPLAIANALGGKPLPIYGDGLQIRDWLHVSDHCAALRAILRAGRVGETYNIGSDNELTNLAMVKQICALLDTKSPRKDGRPHESAITFVTDRRGHDRRYAIDAAKLHNELGWRSLRTFTEGIEHTIDWYLANEAWTAAATSGSYQEWVARQYG